MRRTWVIAFGVIVLLAVGCQRKLTFEKSVSMQPGESKAYLITAPSSEQRFSVEARSADGPVDVYVLLADDENDVLKRMDSNQPLENVVGSKRQEKEAAFEVTIPAKRNFVVALANPTRETSVSLKVNSK